MYIREDQADIRLQVQDSSGNWVEIGDGNSWYDYSGAELSAAGAKTRPGGMGYEIELGGPATRSDCVISIQHSDTMFGFHSFLESRTGKGRARIILTYLDDEGVAIPSAQFRVTGKLKSPALPGQNTANATVGMYKVTIGADQQAQ